MKLLVLMDPLETLKPEKDTSLYFLHEAFLMGWSTDYLTVKDLYFKDGEVRGNVSSIQVKAKGKKEEIKVSQKRDMSLRSFDIVLMRKDPPVDMEYIYATHLLTLLEKQGVLVANCPQSLRDANEKLFLLNFPDCYPPTIVSKNQKNLLTFWEEHRNIVLKPLDGMGGSRVFHVNEEGSNLAVIMDLLTHNEMVTIMAQVYLPEISKFGDKRILLINGKPEPYALLRIPKPGEWRGNLAAGASSRVVSLTKRDHFLCDKIGPYLREKKLYFVGLDVIGDYVTEINVTSPTCAVEISKGNELNIARNYLEFLVSKRM